MSLTAEQIKAVTALGSVSVTAGAGTGKTEMLSERYLHHISRHQLSPLEIVAVTFTDKAAAELRLRIREKVAEQLPDAIDLLAEMEAAQISTIHALAIRICREHPDQAGVPHDFSVMDELDSSLRVAGWFNEALEQLPHDIYQELPYSVLETILRALLKDPIMATRALSRPVADWQKLAATVRQTALNQLRNDDDWQQSFGLINSLFGLDGDRIEEARRNALMAINVVEKSETHAEIGAALTILDKIDLRGGSKKSWPNNSLDKIKAALKTVREIVRTALNDGLITLAPGPVDDRLSRLLPLLQRAFQQVRDYIANAKQQARLLDFADLEDHALQALNDETVRQFYTQRWRAFLIDEFQDTNAVQAEIIEHLTHGAIITIVGDEKQSIYGFRRADVAVFRRFREQILNGGGINVQLSISFRAHHQLIDRVNNIFAPILGELHQELISARDQYQQPGPHLQLLMVEADDSVNKQSRQYVEARRLAALIDHLLTSNFQIQIKGSNEHRAIRPGDIAILSRAWQPLKLYGEALAALNIPITLAGGGSLLETREAKDGWALLRFLADAGDNLALVALLRSPFFAISDRVLFEFAQKLPDDAYWWPELQRCEQLELLRAAFLLEELRDYAKRESPSRLLQMADRCCGYTAVIANLPGAARREADWQGFFEMVQELERRSDDLFVLVRRLKRLFDADIEVPRPPLASGDTITLMTVHGSKGLEWPVVIVPDLTRSAPITSAPIYFDPELGVALKLEDENGEMVKPVLFTLLEQRQRRRETEEARRLLYVALTRARDRVILSATDNAGGNLDLLMPGLQAAGIDAELIKFDVNEALPPMLIESTIPDEPVQILI